jgi:hypothetical protein
MGIRLSTGARVANISLKQVVTPVPPVEPALLYTLDNPNVTGTSVDDRFGFSVSVNGNLIAVCAVEEDDEGIIGNTGKVYLYDATTGLLTYTLSNPNAYGYSGSDDFATGVAVSGNTVVVSAPNEDSAEGVDSGAVYIFDASTGLLTYTLVNPNADGVYVDDDFGASIAIDGNIVVVGAPAEGDGVTDATSGKAYVYDASTGSLLHTLSNPNSIGTGSLDFFGNKVAVSGNTIVVCAYGDGAQSGTVYTFDATTGALVYTISNPNPYGDSDDYFATSVSISGNTIAVGALFESNAGNAGVVYTFDATTGLLVHTILNPNSYGTGEADYFGYVLDISGTTLAIGAPGESTDTATATGVIYLYDATTGLLVNTVNNPDADGTGDGDNFGAAISINGNILVAGSPNESDIGGAGSGKAYVYTIPA